MGVGDLNMFNFEQTGLRLGLVEDVYSPTRRRLAVDSGAILEQAILAGSCYRASSGLITMVMGEHARILITNPFGSGTEMRIVSMIFVNSAQTMQATVMSNPDTGLPATGVDIGNLHYGYEAAGAGEILADVNATALSGGASEPPMLIPVGWSALPDGTILILPEDFTLGLDIEFLAAGTFAWTLYWMEVQVG